MFMTLKSRLRLVWRKWSVRLMAVGLFVNSLFLIDPNLLLLLWNSLPGPLAAQVPVRLQMILSIVFYGGALIAAAVRQPKLEEMRDAARGD
jgi:uncharacterized integral membrane protein